ncbi:PROTEIN THI031 putative-RELATED [Salix koriyanagi]|uniref:PROTEIN THI031 putative-RELATED n=1 Tax=Salix koriyanagi TaxID=2511006 RepID=A0A9Q1AMM6_9ROSI|nr:PROTEIN THI031 putative-RELATED [Salix koriyanagi]
MRREGRPHGMVRAYSLLPSPWNPKPGGDRKFNQFDTPTTAGVFTKVSSKPTNHSKFTGKCVYYLAGCEMVRMAQSLSGFSATGMLNQLASTGDHDYSDNEEDDFGR